MRETEILKNVPDFTDEELIRNRKRVAREEFDMENKEQKDYDYREDYKNGHQETTSMGERGSG